MPIVCCSWVLSLLCSWKVFWKVFCVYSQLRFTAPPREEVHKRAMQGAMRRYCPAQGHGEMFLAQLRVPTRVFVSACPTLMGGVSEFLSGWVSNRPPPPPPPPLG